MFIIEHFTNSKTKLSAGPDPCITTDPVHQKTHDNVKVHAATVPGTKMSPDHQTLIPNWAQFKSDITKMSPASWAQPSQGVVWSLTWLCPNAIICRTRFWVSTDAFFRMWICSACLSICSACFWDFASDSSAWASNLWSFCRSPADSSFSASNWARSSCICSETDFGAAVCLSPTLRRNVLDSDNTWEQCF